ncbi:MAG: hypothetical protein NZ693_09860 [Thermoflexales bacterium]|nr:hypothetical protein [Thermoflexales bacterium]
MRGRPLLVETLQQIARLRVGGASYESIAKRLGLRKSTVHDAFKGLVSQLNAADRTYLHAVLAWRNADAVAAGITDPESQRLEAETVLLLRDYSDHLVSRANRTLRALGCAPVTPERVIEDAARLARGERISLPTEGTWGFLHE